MSPKQSTRHDVLIIGAGLSGINVACRLPEGTDYAVIEARSRIGGTWDLFRYPGVRSDSDVYTLSYPFRPWKGRDSIADGADLRDYIEDTAVEKGIVDKVTFNTRATAADWDSAAGEWTVTCVRDGVEVAYAAKYLVCSTGYYDYDSPHAPVFDGAEDFRGCVVHPQFWPEDLDYTGKNVVVIGSGATAITLVPSMAEDAARVTMLQRTPTYVLSQPRVDKFANALRRTLPGKLSNTLVRAKNNSQQWALVVVSGRFPGVVKRLLLAGVAAGTGSKHTAQEHFTPPYNPWEQRLCIVPDSDLFHAIKDGSAEVVTGHIDCFVPEGVKLSDGSVIPADIIVTATGLRIELLGGVTLSLDGEPVDFSQHYTWYGTMFSGIPNFSAVIGYINHSWTIRADMTAKMIAKILRRMRETGSTMVTPIAPSGLGEGRPYMDMQSGYLARAAAAMPRATQKYPWSVQQNVLVDTWNTGRASLDRDLEWR
ncbi:NAD(P)/FAD-dependent oxidoreductase [Corynebacterium qintianiae]|uniref:NAD(P)/FAD-dependent oxidoreductase n=1 Tax=Corynebacterium qintianiae TaxID=2709392 RepID=A0A7T0KPN8_9CORY|nr:NAD(P)/FAD-dependent oxidoreductase [Corynebacterium qintianiae]QPK83733.1 NAD(P)/FAD-dependent oxidoreductase [Corynebacterium qintianiae]